MGKNNFIFIYMDPPKSREERRREKEAARQRKQRKKEIQEKNYKIKNHYLICKEIIWLLEHEGSKKKSPCKIYATIFFPILLLSIVVIIASFICGSSRMLCIGILMFITAYLYWAQNFQVHADAKRIIADSLDQEYIDDYVSKYGEIK